MNPCSRSTTSGASSRSVRRGLRGALGLLLGALIVLPGCPAPTTVIQRPGDGFMFKRVEVRSGGASVDVPPEVLERFGEALERELLAEGRFERGDRLDLSYRFVAVDGGSEGDGPLRVEVVYKSPAGRRLAKIATGRQIPAGPYAGNVASAVDRAAREVADYTVTHFLRDDPVEPVEPVEPAEPVDEAAEPPM